MKFIFSYTITDSFSEPECILRILIFSHPCAESFSNRKFYSIIADKTGWEIHIVYPSNWTDEYGKHPSVDEKLNLIFHSFPVWLPGNVPLHLYQSRLTNLLAEVAPDVIYAHHEPYGIATFQILLANHATVNCPFGFYSAQNIFKKYPFPFSNFEKYVLNKSHFAFPITNSVADVLKKKKFKGNIQVLPLSIDSSVHYPVDEYSDVTDSLKIRETDFIIGYVGRVVEQKGLKTLLLALNSLKETNWKLLIVGTGSYENEFCRIAKQLNLFDKILFVGHIDRVQVSRYFSLFDLLVIPSETRKNWKEQFGRVILESLACSTAVIGSSSGEIPILIEETEGGLVFPEADYESFASSLSHLINNPQTVSSLAERGRETVLRSYTHDAVSDKFIRKIQEIFDNVKSI